MIINIIILKHEMEVPVLYLKPFLTLISSVRALVSPYLRVIDL
jgi:hypothetical protein